ncbi:Heterogeneous nuclear ribonucleoprotein C [Gracilariopsis chorda]|uniref:Heterogeneous nuclear ribonucleoprotein C n=1 Tax=Gracilariopsis chorda TaxID=448386 RepID=A0A2V3IZT0_9FLOR|nr:Heterogeneous nuclear ribonucleoprotein C [Gracilariopsis chorda]|eukprot:PXF47648.1 Heterogeneous nuclear ribonucleoprotein C [Gracilariopsis chorda]
MSASHTSDPNTHPTSHPSHPSATVSDVQNSLLETRSLPPQPDNTQQQHQSPAAQPSPQEPKVPVSPTTPSNNPLPSNPSNAVEDTTTALANQSNLPSGSAPATEQIEPRNSSPRPPSSPETNRHLPPPGLADHSQSATTTSVPKVEPHPPKTPTVDPTHSLYANPSSPTSHAITQPDPLEQGLQQYQPKSQPIQVAHTADVPPASPNKTSTTHQSSQTHAPLKAETVAPSQPSFQTPEQATADTSAKADHKAEPTYQSSAQPSPDSIAHKDHIVTQGTATPRAVDAQTDADNNREKEQPPPLPVPPSAPTSLPPPVPPPQERVRPQKHHPDEQPSFPAGNDINSQVRDLNPSSPRLLLSTRSLPRNLPKYVKSRPKNARVFIGNLASEYTSPREIVEIFHKYGTLIEEPVLRRSFGFVQYSTAESASLAVKNEQGRMIGGIALDLSIADNREVKKGTHIQNNTPFQHPKSHLSGQFPQTRGRVRDRDHSGLPQQGARKRRRSVSPNSALRKGGVHPPQYGRQRPDPKNGIFLRILCMSPTAKGYARHCENVFRNMTGLNADILYIVATNLGEALGKAMRDTIPYVMVVASRDVEAGTCTIRTLEKTGYEKSGRGNGVIPLKEAVEVCLIERGVIMPSVVANQYTNMGPVQGNRGGNMHQNMGANGGMGSSRPQWGMQHGMPPPDNKSGWGLGSRGPRGGRNIPNPSPMGSLPVHPPPPPPVPPVMNGSGYGYDSHGGSTNYGQSNMGGTGRDEDYSRSGYDMGAQGSGAEYGRSAAQSYTGNGMNSYTSDQYGQSGSRGAYGSGADHEYDPAAVTPTQRPGATVGDGYNWNRGTGTRDMAYGGNAQTTTNGSGSQRLHGSYTPGGQYSSNEYTNNGQYHDQGQGQYGGAYDSRHSYGNVGNNAGQGYDGYGNAGEPYASGNDTRDQYNTQPYDPRYGQGRSNAPYRSSGWSESVSGRPMNNQMGMYYNAPNQVGRTGGMRSQADASQDNRYGDNEYGRNDMSAGYTAPPGYGNRQVPGPQVRIRRVPLPMQRLSRGRR